MSNGSSHLKFLEYTSCSLGFAQKIWAAEEGWSPKRVTTMGWFHDNI